MEVEKNLDDVEWSHAMYEWSMQAQYHGGYQDGYEIGYKEGIAIAKAISIGEANLGKLTSALIDDKRYEDAKKACEDAEYRKELYLEYGILEN